MLTKMKIRIHIMINMKKTADKTTIRNTNRDTMITTSIL